MALNHCTPVTHTGKTGNINVTKEQHVKKRETQMVVKKHSLSAGGCFLYFHNPHPPPPHSTLSAAPPTQLHIAVWFLMAKKESSPAGGHQSFQRQHTGIEGSTSIQKEEEHAWKSLLSRWFFFKHSILSTFLAPFLATSLRSGCSTHDHLSVLNFFLRNIGGGGQFVLGLQVEHHVPQLLPQLSNLLHT